MCLRKKRISGHVSHEPLGKPSRYVVIRKYFEVRGISDAEILSLYKPLEQWILNFDTLRGVLTVKLEMFEAIAE